MGDLFQQLFIAPILNLLVIFLRFFEVAHVPFALGFAIIALTAFVRLLVAPLMHAQLRSAHKMAKLQPKLAKLKKEYEKDKAKLQQEQMKLYQEAGINPAAGCLPMLVQIPIFLALFRVFSTVLDGNNTNHALDFINQLVYSPALRITSLDLSFFGLDLIAKPSEWQVKGLFLLAIPLITGGLQYVQSKQMMGMQKHENEEVLKTPAKEEEPEDMSQSIQKQMALITPIMIGVFSYSFPVGLALYWNTFTLFGILQQYILQKEHDNGR